MTQIPEWLGGNIPLPAVLVDEGGAIRDLNDPARAYFHQDGDALDGMQLSDILPDAVVPLFLYYFLKAPNRKPRLFTATVGGEETPTGFLVTPLFARDGAFRGAMLLLCPVICEEYPALTQDDLRMRGVTKRPLRPATRVLFKEKDGKDGDEARAAAILLDDAALGQSIGPPPDPKPAAEPAALTKKEPATDKERRKALLVEDNQVIRTIAGKIVEQLDFDVDFAVNGVEAVEKCRVEPYDIVLMDMFMPVMNGDEATRRIRALPPPFGEVPILVVTASDIGEERESLLEAGVTAFLKKPFTVKQVEDAMKSLFDY